MAAKAEGGYSIIMGLEASAFAVPHLIGMSGADSSVLRPTVHARSFSDSLKELLITVSHEFAEQSSTAL